jgi:peptide subunit release factor RF-3
MTTVTVDKEEFVRKCGQVYRRNKQNLESKYEGKMVALYEEGVAAIGTSIDEVSKAAEKKFPDKIFYVRRIGKYSAAGILF